MRQKTILIESQYGRGIQYSKSITLLPLGSEKPWTGKFLGKGRFSQAWLMDNGEVLLICKNDWAKELLARIWRTYPPEEREYLPKMEYAGLYDPDAPDVIKMYFTNYTSSLTAKEYPSQWRDFCALKDLWKSVVQDVRRKHGYGKIISGYVYCEAFVNALLAKKKKGDGIGVKYYDTFLLLVNESFTYGDSTCLEFRKCNVGIHKGELIFRDVLFFQDQIISKAHRVPVSFLSCKVEKTPPDKVGNGAGMGVDPDIDY